MATSYFAQGDVIRSVPILQSFHEKCREYFVVSRFMKLYKFVGNCVIVRQILGLHAYHNNNLCAFSIKFMVNLI